MCVWVGGQPSLKACISLRNTATESYTGEFKPLTNPSLQPTGNSYQPEKWKSILFWFCPHCGHSLGKLGLEQAAGKVAALPAQAGGLGMFVQVAGLAEPLATLEASIGLFSCMNADMLLAICQGQKSLAADFAGVLASSLYN